MDNAKTSISLLIRILLIEVAVTAGLFNIMLIMSIFSPLLLLPTGILAMKSYALIFDHFKEHLTKVTLAAVIGLLLLLTFDHFFPIHETSDFFHKDRTNYLEAIHNITIYLFLCHGFIFIKVFRDFFRRYIFYSQKLGLKLEKLSKQFCLLCDLIAILYAAALFYYSIFGLL